MKKVLMVLGGLLIVGALAVGCLWWCSRVSNPWDAKCVGDIPAPIGYERVGAEKGSYQEWMRELPLKPKGTKVMLYTGGEANFQFLSTGVIDMPLLSNAEQCADVTMRLRAEYLYHSGKWSEICFTDVNGKKLKYSGGHSRKALEKYLRKAYECCSTFSVSRETQSRKISEVEAGDVLVYPARKIEGMGHALIVVDVARKGNKVAIMCAEGNTPARDIHIVRNPNVVRNPWFIFDGDERVFWISAFHFEKDELRHY